MLKFPRVFVVRAMNFYSDLQRIRTGDISQTDINRFIEKLIQIALRFVKYNSGRIKNITNGNFSFLEDIAVDSIVPFFTRSQSDGELFIISRFTSWKPEITTEEEAKYFLIKTISLSVSQRINTLLKEYDPFFSKILDSVNYFIKAQNFNKASIAGKIYITEPEVDADKCRFADRESLCNSPAVLISNKKEMLSSLFSYFRKMYGVPAAIPFYDLIYRIKEINLSGEISRTIHETGEMLEIREITERGLLIVSVKAEESYLRTGKLGKDEFKSMIKALKLIRDDLMDGGINPGLFKYLNETMPALTKVEYELKYHNIFEYLVKLYRQQLAELIS